MKTRDLFNLLENEKHRNLKFEYQPNAFVGANYHITEVKHVNIDSVDCGARTDQWNETIIQLWESPDEHDKEEYMSAYKAHGILNKVGRLKPYDQEAEVKFEYSNSHFHTAQMYVQSYEVVENDLILKLSVHKTDCKARDLCGVQAVEVEAAAEEPCCSPDGNCC